MKSKGKHFYVNNERGIITVDFTFQHGRNNKDRLVSVIFCDGEHEWILKGEKYVKRAPTYMTMQDTVIQYPGGRLRLSKSLSRKLWDFLQLNGYRVME